MNSKKATIYDYARMCKSHEDCAKCPIAKTASVCYLCIAEQPDKASEIILKWCEEHPVETRQSKIQNTIRHLRKNDEGVVDVCPNEIDFDFNDECCNSYKSCDRCKKDYWLAEADENEQRGF